jgi:sporadic carbohydrate cluster protein (TIGR04323 family)
MSDRSGFRGYIGSRGYFGDRTPQHVQNLVIRDFCSRNGYRFLLSATEYAMPSCYMILEDLIREAPKLDGIVCYSIFMMPMRRARRMDVVSRIFEAGATLHGALENVDIRNRDELDRLDLIWAMREMSLSPGSLAQYAGYF